MQISPNVRAAAAAETAAALKYLRSRGADISWRRQIGRIIFISRSDVLTSP